MQKGVIIRYMIRKYLNDLIEWKDKLDRKPLIVWGARQTGKTYLVEELFAKEYFSNRYLRLDLSDEVDFVKYAEDNSNLEKILEYIELHYDFHADCNHLLFFDEAQECPSIIKSLKQFCEKRKDIPVIVSGSLVRLKLHRMNKKSDKGFLFPVGKVNTLFVYPMSFDEFLINYDINKYNYIKTHFENKKPIDLVIHKELIDCFNSYMFTGGMPEVVDCFIKNKKDRIQSYKIVQERLKEIYDDYLDDMSLYQASIESIIRSKKIYNDIFKQLNKENKNFKIGETIKGAKNRDMINPYFWLSTSNVVHESYCLKEKVTIPLTRNEDSLFRLYLSDIGMFTYQSKLNYKTFLMDKNNVLSGIYYENYVAQELVCNGYDLFYWKGKRNSELEFILSINNELITIDVKKTKGSLNSLNEFRTHNKKSLAIKVSQNQYGYDANNMILTLPFYYFSLYLNEIKRNS